METSIQINKIIDQIAIFDNSSKISLIEKILKTIQIHTDEKTISKLTELNGLGSNIWKNIDIERYIENERQWD
ncbi:MAG: hypothetical protein JEY97_02745 [Bacteroidales bacterium]|nr:hypothetical protein [Bacteroidales bacterium]